MFAEVRRWYETHLHPDANEYDDPNVYKHVYHEQRWCGIFQCTQPGAQKFFAEAKPENITDIAALTSIFRPGPLSAGVQHIYLDAKLRDKKFEWGHPIFEKVLGDTYNALIFQESVMDLAEHVGGFPKDQCDNVRRAIMKRDHSKGEAAKKEVEKMRADFVKGAVERGIPETTAQKSYDTIEFMSGYGFNRSHATAYAIDSYMCAWLLTNHPHEWLIAYLETMSGNDESRRKAFAEIRSIGHDIVNIDVNHATKSWTTVPGGFMPSLLSIKGVGATAADELIASRPIIDIVKFLYDDDGSWRLSKLNKRALEGLINVEAFESVGCVGPDAFFSSYRHMHEVIIGHGNEIKKQSKKDPFIGMKRFHELVRDLRCIEPWSRQERIENNVKHFGTVDPAVIVPPNVMSMLDERDVKSIDEHTGDENVHWFIIVDVKPKVTKNGKKYLLLTVQGLSGKTARMNAWGWDGKRTFSKYCPVAAPVSSNSFGFSTMAFKIKELV